MPVRAPSRWHAVLLGRVAAAAGLAISAYLHVALASGPLVSDGQVTLAGLFSAQALVATTVAVWVLLARSTAADTAAALVGAGSLAAVVLSTYVRLPAVGPFPVLYEPFWYPEKVAAALTAALTSAAAVAVLTATRTGRSRRHPTASPGSPGALRTGTVQPLEPREHARDR